MIYPKIKLKTENETDLGAWGVFFIIILFASCKTYEQAGGIRWDKSFNTTGFFTQAFVTHTTNDSSLVTIKFIHESFGQQPGYRKYVTINCYTEAGKSERIYTGDSLRKSIVTGIRTDEDTVLQIPFRFLRNQEGTMLIRISSSDSSMNTFHYIELDKDHIHHSSFFHIYLNENKLLNPQMIKTTDSVRVTYFNKDIPDCSVAYYRFGRHPAVPTFFRPDSSGLPHSPDSIFVYHLNTQECFTKPGLYHFIIDNDSIGLNLVVHDPEYPELKSVKEIIYPLRYITKNEEYKKLLESKNPKGSLDSFWINRYHDTKVAKKMIRVYFNRVEFANKYFTTYRPGWMTDQGLIYIFYGKPDRSYKFKDGEIWVYTRHLSQVTEFAFIHKESRFGNFLELKRNADYLNSWNEQSFKWRHGSILND